MFDFLKQKIKTFFKTEQETVQQKIETAPPVKPIETPKATPKREAQPKPAIALYPELASKPKATPEPIAEAYSELAALKKAPEEHAEPKTEKPKASITTFLKQKILGKAAITEKDLEGLLLDFELNLLEADVAMPVAKIITSDVKKKLVGREITRSEDLLETSRQAVRESLERILKQERVDLVQRIREKPKKPFVIVFLGPNGHGKSTTISKVAHYLKKHGVTSVVAAADTFRAAAIEQIETLASRAGVPTVKQKYGADPAAVCFDAVKYAESHGADCVLADTAGRSELNTNLMQQLKKIVRVAKPDLKIYVSEALAGNAALEEAKRFNEAVGIDAMIITKVDCDVKGGSILSISHETGKPLLFLGMGQDLDDLAPFEPEWFIQKIL